MRLDPKVERLKFDAEVARLTRNKARLGTMGVLLVSATQPVVDLIFLGSSSVNLALPIQVGNSATGEKTFLGLEFPALTTRAFGVRLDLAGYDQRPASVSFCDPRSWEPASFATLPRGQIHEPPGQPQVVLVEAHPQTQQPFLCIRGVREYHEHPQHNGDDWAMYRNSINILALVERIARIMAAAPLVMLQPQILWTVNSTR